MDMSVSTGIDAGRSSATLQQMSSVYTDQNTLIRSPSSKALRGGGISNKEQDPNEASGPAAKSLELKDAVPVVLLALLLIKWSLQANAAAAAADE